MTDVTPGQEPDTTNQDVGSGLDPGFGQGAGRITLADCDGQVWLVGGEEHVDDLLIGALPPSVSVELVRCATRPEVWALWEELTPDGGENNQPWALNPALTGGLLARLGLSRNELRFGSWSAAIDAAAGQVIANVASWLATHPGGRLVLRQFLPEPVSPGLPDLQRLRAQLVRGALDREGVPAGAVEEDTLAGEAGEADLMLIATEPAS